MASAEDRATVVRRLTQLVERDHGGTGADAWRAAFAKADVDGDGRINADELADVLKRAGVGNWITRGAWATGVLDELDKNGDDSLSVEELLAVLANRVGPGAPSPDPAPRPPAPPSPNGKREPSAPLTGPVGERLNNAIGRLHYRAQFARLSPSTREQVDQLMDEWERFWRGGARALLPEYSLTWHYQTFLLRYAQAWVAMPPEIQRRTIDPRRIDVALADTVHDSMRNYVDALREEGKLIQDFADATGRWATGLAVIAIGGLLAFGLARRR